MQVLSRLRPPGRPHALSLELLTAVPAATRARKDEAAILARIKELRAEIAEGRRELRERAEERAAVMAHFGCTPAPK